MLLRDMNTYIYVTFPISHFPPQSPNFNSPQVDSPLGGLGVPFPSALLPFGLLSAPPIPGNT